MALGGGVAKNERFTNKHGTELRRDTTDCLENDQFLNPLQFCTSSRIYACQSEFSCESFDKTTCYNY